jgi:hypothetical protein
LSEEQLIEFIKIQGNERKKALLQITKYQTSDYNECRSMLDSNLEALSTKAQALVDFEEKEVGDARAINDLDAQIEDMTKRIAAGGGSLDSQEAQVKSCKTKLD